MSLEVTKCSDADEASLPSRCFLALPNMDRTFFSCCDPSDETDDDDDDNGLKDGWCLGRAGVVVADIGRNEPIAGLDRFQRVQS